MKKINKEVHAKVFSGIDKNGSLEKCKRCDWDTPVECDCVCSKEDQHLCPDYRKYEWF
jgi:hypothetical protein